MPGTAAHHGRRGGKNPEMPTLTFRVPPWPLGGGRRGSPRGVKGGMWWGQDPPPQPLKCVCSFHSPLPIFSGFSFGSSNS